MVVEDEDFGFRIPRVIARNIWDCESGYEK